VYLLDTNIVSELRKPRPHGGVVAWLQSVDDADLHLAAVTLGEIQAGVELTRDQDPSKAEHCPNCGDKLKTIAAILEACESAPWLIRPPTLPPPCR
jgi:toxin FitB